MFWHAECRHVAEMAPLQRRAEVSSASPLAECEQHTSPHHLIEVAQVSQRQVGGIRLLWPNHQGPLVWYLHCVPAKSSVAHWATPRGVIQEQLLQFLPEGLRRMFLHTLVINSTYPFLKASLLPSQIKIHIWPWQQSGREQIHHYPTQVLLPAESK